MKDWIEQLQVFFLRFKIDRPFVPVVPEFRMTLMFLWLLALAGLIAGFRNVLVGPSSLALTLSAIAAVGSFIILLLRQPWSHLLLFVKQMCALILVAAFMVIAYIALGLVWPREEVIQSIKLAWIGGAILLGYLALHLTFLTFIILPAQGPAFPAMRSAALLVWFFGLNYALWWLQAYLPFVS